MEEIQITAEDFKHQLYSLCMGQIVEAIKGIGALDYVRRDRGLFAYERYNLKCLHSQLKTNEEWVIFADPTYTRVQ